MGFLDSIVDFFGGGGNLLKAGTQIAGSLLASDANQDAAERIAQGSNEAAQIAADAYLRGAKITDEGHQRAQERLQPLATTSAPAIAYLRRVMAQDPSMLTPAQQTMRADLLRRASNTLATSGLRGSGRAVTASIRDVDRRFRDDSYGENLRRADQAAGQLAGVHTSTVGSIADIDRRAAQDRANAVTKGGEAFSRATQTGAEAGASADLADARQWGTAMGMIGSLMAQDRKERSGAYPVGQNIQWSGPRYTDDPGFYA